MTKGLVIVSFIQQAIADASKAAVMGQGLGFDLSKLPAGADIFSMIARLPEAQLTTISSSINEKFNAFGCNLANQMAVSAVKDEYIALGMDITALQTNYILKTGISMLLLTLLLVLCTIAVSLFIIQNSSRICA